METHFRQSVWSDISSFVCFDLLYRYRVETGGDLIETTNVMYVCVTCFVTFSIEYRPTGSADGVD